MMIGPEPMTSTDFRSGRLGTVRSGRHRDLSISSQNSVNRPDASCGPGAASGWYCTLKTGRSSSRKPSTTPSLRLTWLTTAGPYGVSNCRRACAGTCDHVVALGASPEPDVSAETPGAIAWDVSAETHASAGPCASPGSAAAKPWLWLVM